MTTWAVFRVKDEADILAETVGWMLGQVDHVVVVDNGSTDGTREILDELGCEVVDDHAVAYYQSRAVSALAARARERGAEWVISADADEIWRSRVDGATIAEALRSLPAHVLVAEAQLFDHVATGVDPDGPPVQRMGWRRPEPAPLRKVACRAVEGLVIHQGNHSASFPGVAHPAAVTDVLEVRHYPLRSIDQMIRKARNGAEAYAATTLPEGVGGHWRGWGKLTDEQIGDVFRRYYFRSAPGEPLTIDGERQTPLVYDPVPLLW